MTKRREYLYLSALLIVGCTRNVDGYGGSVREKIWHARETSNESSQKEASEKCHYSPASTSYLIDDDRDVDFSAVANPEYLRSLRKMLRDDQNARDLYNVYGDSDTSLVRAIDKRNIDEFKALISEKGFPTSPMVGPAGMGAMMLLIAHADRDRDFQLKSFEVIEERSASGAIPGYVALTLKSIRPNVFGSPYQLQHRDSKTVMAKDDGKSAIECYRKEQRLIYMKKIRNKLPAKYGALSIE
jgi:hypothetical protein